MTDQALALSWAAKEKDFPLFENATCRGTAEEPSCGDIMEIRMEIDAFGLVRRMGFSLPASACPPVRACAAYACAFCQGKPVLVAFTLGREQLSHALTEDGAPDPEHVHCLLMTEVALKSALAHYGQRFRP